MNVNRWFGIPFLKEIVLTSSTNLWVIKGAVGMPNLSTVIQWPATAGAHVLQWPTPPIIAWPFALISSHSFGSSSK